MKLNLYLIVCQTKPRRYVQLHPSSFELVTKPTKDCLVTKEQAKTFLSHPGIDPRYQLYTAQATFTKLTTP